MPVYQDLTNIKENLFIIALAITMTHPNTKNAKSIVNLYHARYLHTTNFSPPKGLNLYLQHGKRQGAKFLIQKLISVLS